MLLALGLSERPLEGRRLLIKRGDDHRANPDARTPKTLPSGPGTTPSILQKQKNPESATLFVGNLPFDVTEEELRALVEGNATDGFVVPDVRAGGEGEGEGGDEDEDQEKEDDDDDEKDDDDDDEGEDGEDGADGDAGPQRSGKRSGLLKTRVAQFEDTGRCKGFAFWDFKSSDHAKAALMNRRNHFLRGQKLNVQFASESATSRAGRGKKAAAGGGKKIRPGKQERNRQKHRAEGGDGGEGGAANGGDGQGEGARERKGDVRGKKWESAGRPRPGAALAMAQREKVGIVESQGAKITFD